MKAFWIVSTLLLGVAGCAPTTPSALPPPANAGGDENVAPAALQGEWKVTSFGGKAVGPDSRISVGFEGSRVFGSGGCNRIAGSYALGGPGDSFQIKLGQMASTMMACPEQTMRDEQAFLALLEQVTAYQSTPDGLVLTTASGQRIEATRMP